MRKRLERLVGQRCQFRAVFIRFGKVNLPGNRIKRYMLIENVMDVRHRHITKHMWMPLRAEDYVYARPQTGDPIRFDAEINIYFKGNKRRRVLDYGLCKPLNVERIEQVETEQEA